ncbi:MAG: ABC transporter permease [Bacteroidota bacterium]
MFKNYLITFFRKALRRKAFAVINIAGLSVSFAGVILIFLYVSNELSFDQFQDHNDRIYRVYAALAQPGEAVKEFPATPPNLGPLLSQKFDGVQSAARVFEENVSTTITRDDQSFNELNVYNADSSFFNVFTVHFLAGDRNALVRPASVVLSHTAADRIFGDWNKALGKELKTSDVSYTVTGVVEDFPSNSHFRFTCLLSIDYVNENLNPGNWLAHWPVTYLLLKENADRADLEDRLRRTTDKILDPVYLARYGKSYQEQKAAGGLQEYRFQPLRDVHLYSSHMGEKGNILYVYIFVAIGVMLICIASFNYINLTTARSAWEAKSTGVRKVLGATKSQLFRQFITDSIAVSLLSAFAGIIISQLVLTMNSSFIRQFIPDEILPATLCLMVLGLSIVIGLLSGSVPARLLNAFQPTQVLKGQLIGSGRGNGLRQVLVVTQFVISIGLIISTLVITRQLTYMRDLALGFDKEHLLVVKNIGNLGDSKLTLKQSIANENFVVNSSLVYGMLGRPENGAAFTPVEMIEQKKDLVVGMPIYIADHDYLPTIGTKLLMGHAFPEGLTRGHQQIILNKEALRAVGWQDRAEKDVVGQMIDVNGLRYELAGVVDDYHFMSLRQKVTPMAILSHYYQDYTALLIRIRPGTTTQAIASVEDHWKQISPGVPFEYSFVDEDLDKLYASEQELSVLFVCFAGVAIFVACLGLLGLAIFAAERSVKEIGIRKVLGASVTSIVLRLSRSMLVLVLVAFVIATPVSWYMMDRWLENFAYRSSIDVSLFAIAGGLTLIVAMLTIIFHATKAAVANPVRSLKAE